MSLGSSETPTSRSSRDVARSDWSWSRPNRRLLDAGLYLPDLAGERMGRVIVAIDVSGSINQSELNLFWGEVRGVADELNPDYVNIICCSNHISTVEEFEGYDLPDKLDVKGQGGTAFAPVFDYVDANIVERPACLIYFTDMMCRKPDYPDYVPDYPVLWASTLEPSGHESMRSYGGFYPPGEEPFGEYLQLEFD